MKLPFRLGAHLPVQFLDYLRYVFSVLGLDQERCVHCRAPVDTGPGDAPHLGPGGSKVPLCALCAPHFMPYAGLRCPLCGEPGPYASPSSCPQCGGNGQGWDSVHFFGLYESWLRDALLRFKFGGELAQGPFLAACLLQVSQCLPRPDALVAIPQHRAHLRKRGFNQAHEVAKGLAKQSGFAVNTALLTRVQQGLLQHTLSGQARRNNLSHAFAASPMASGKAIWLIDDIMTTGSTLAAAAQALKAAGAVRVDCLVVARTA